MMQRLYLGLRQGVASASCVEALSDTILLSAIRAYHCLHLLQSGVATVRTEQAARLLHNSGTNDDYTLDV